jgi:hypothetical protein
MAMRRIVSGILVFSMLPLLCSARSANLPEDPGNTYKEGLPFYSISAINQANLPQGQYNTEGYVIMISVCPPCPAGAVCETCLIDHLVISETGQPPALTGSRIRNTDLVLFADDVTRFKTGEKYRFSLRIPGAYRFDTKYMTGYSNRFRITGYKHFSAE